MEPAHSDPELFKNTIELSKKFNCNYFIETGTYLGSNILLLKDHFEYLHTIEVDEGYYMEACLKLLLQRPIVDNIKVYLGDTVNILPMVLKENTKYSIFLDAHGNDPSKLGVCPLIKELNIIKSKNLKPVIMIHDFFVPLENHPNTSKFKYDNWMDENGTLMLRYEYIKPSLEGIYGVGGFDYHYSENPDIDSGLIYIYPKTNTNEEE